QLSRLPMSFEANRGQTDRRVKFISRGSGYTLFLTPTEAVLSLRRGQAQSPSVLRMRLVGADPRSRVEGRDELTGKVNYFKGPGRGGNVESYSKVHYGGVYPGVDMVYYGRQRELEYDFIVAPGGDPGRIRLAFEGARRLSLDPDGDLVLETAAGQVRQRRPVAYQEIDGGRREVAADYVLQGRRRVGFRVGDYDPTRPLVIDPVIDYSTYLGGGQVDEGSDIVVDADGKIYVTGFTMSVNFPVSAGAYDTTCLRCANWGVDAYVTKIDPAQTGAASLVFSSFLGSATTGNTEGRAVAVDASNNVYVVGTTTARDFPTTANALQPTYQFMSANNSFLTKFDATGGSVLYSTYLEGNNVDEAADVTVDADDNVYVAGRTASTNFPVVNASQPNNAGMFDAFVMKLDHQGFNSYALLYSTYLGGINNDGASSLALDGSGNVYLTGTTQSADLAGTTQNEGFPVLNGFQPALSAGGDAFMTKLGPGPAGGASLLYSTYIGGSNHENSVVQSGGIAVDANNMAYVTGTTNSANFPLKTPWDSTLGYYDAFVTKIDASLAGNASLVYSTYLGGSALELGNDIAVDSQGRAYVTGTTQATDFPVTTCGSPDGPLSDGFIAVLDSAGSGLAFSTHLGGGGYETVNAIAVDALGTAYVTGNTDSANFPHPGAYQPTLGGLSPGSYFMDAFVTKLAPTCP
ncbi:MAG: SBBP repeat-containing protein, partial [Pyrinomonadaceae bacterium]